LQGVVRRQRTGHLGLIPPLGAFPRDRKKNLPTPGAGEMADKEKWAVGDFRDMNCPKCQKKTEHIYGWHDGIIRTYHYWKCTVCGTETRTN
jgi:hypothetical protein